jgi:hypothetical protein
MAKFAELSDDKVFFDDRGLTFVLDRKSEKMFLVDSDIVGEVSDRTTKLKILLESSVMEESKALNFMALEASPVRASSAAAE